VDVRPRHPWHGLDAQQTTLGATERDEEQRHAFRQQIAAASATDFVIVAEPGRTLNRAPRYARAPRGARAPGYIPRTTPRTTTVIAAMTTDGMGAARVIDGATDTTAFAVDGAHVLVPTLTPGPVGVLDNLSAHHSGRVRSLSADAGCALWYVPAYSPDLSPIEEACSQRKTLLRRAKARTKAPLLEAIGRALDQMTSNDAHGYFTHCGFHVRSTMDH
jgi:transposase